ncbi:MAG: tetratricopeptide repeat protein [Acidobacteriaceae bacterium]|nr:tetratricopeptide repeat protein [Acidobacteriaceae bacterium]
MSDVRRISTALILCSALASLAFSGQSEPYNQTYDLAASQLEAGDVAGARQLIQQFLKKEDRAELHNLLGDVEERSGNFREAAKQYEIAARMDPSEKNIFDLGTELLKYHGYRQALQIFTYGVNEKPKSAKLHVGLGVAQYSLGQYQEAVETLCQAVDLDPSDGRALDFLGKMYDAAPSLTGKVTERLAHFAKLYPHNPAANYYYALSLRTRATGGGSTQANQQAKALLLQAVRDKPEFAEAHYQLGLLYQDESQAPQAIGEYQTAVRLRPDLKNAHYRLAQLYAKQGRPDLARSEYEAVKRLGGQ